MSQGFDNKTTDAQKIFPSERKLTEVADIGCIQKSLVQHFQDIKNPRVERTVHSLRMLVAFALSTAPGILLFYDASLLMPSIEN